MQPASQTLVDAIRARVRDLAPVIVQCDWDRDGTFTTTRTIAGTGGISAQTTTAPTWQTSALLAGATAANAAVPVPTGMAATDVAVVCAYLEPSVTVTPPDGTWTERATAATTGTRLRVFWHRATATESGTWTFTHASCYREWYAFRVSGCRTTGDPFDASDVQSADATATTTPGVQVTTTSPNTLLVWAATSIQGSDSFTVPAGFTAVHATNSAGTGVKANAALGATGSQVGGFGGGTERTGFLGALAGITTTTTGTASAAPDVIKESTNLTGTVADIDEDPASPDAAYLTAVSASVPTKFRASFGVVPPGGLGATPQVQLYLRRTATGTPDPWVVLDLWENGSFRAELGAYQVTSTTGQLVTASFNPALLRDPSGSGVEVAVTALPQQPTTLTPASDVAAAITAAPDGSMLVFTPGVYRPVAQAGYAPKPNQILRGRLGATLSGAKTLGTWTASGQDWWATRLTGANGSALPDDPGDGLRCSTAGCRNPNDVYRDGAQLDRVMSQAALAPGRFYEDFAANRVYVRDNPNGHLMEQAWATYVVRSANAGVTVENLVVEMAANAEQTGAVEAAGANWTVQFCEVRYCHGSGLHLNGAGSKERHNRTHHNGQLGQGGYAAATHEDSEIDHNNTRGYKLDWEAGGTKFQQANDVVVRRLYVHDNTGVGLWTDINVGGTTVFEYNYCANNTKQGIMHEIAYDAVIRYNTCVNNAPGAVNAFYDGGQIVVSASRNVQVYNNTVRGRDGIGLLQQLRTDWPDGRGAHELHTVSVHDNDISVTDLGGWHEPTGLVCDAATLKPQVWTTWGNTWAANHYHCSPTSSAVFDWSDGWRDFATWQATYAMDTPAGTIDATIPAFPAPPVPDVGPR